MIILIYSLLTILCFIYILNLHLRGAKKQVLEIVLSVLITLTVILSFFISTWWYGIISIFSVFILNAIFRPIASALAFRILGYRTGIDDKPSTDLYQGYKKDGNIVNAMQIADKKARKNRKRLMKIYNKPNIQNILSQENIDFEEFYSIFKKINIVLYDIVWEILSTPIDLKHLIDLEKNNATNDEIFIHFRNYKN